MSKTIGMGIRKARLAKNLTQSALADLLCVSPQAVSRWESGAAAPDIGLLPALVKHLEVSADELLGIPRKRREPEALTFFLRLEEESRKRPFDSKKICGMLRKIRTFYLDSSYMPRFWLELDTSCFSTLEILPEVRKTAEAMLQAKPAHWIRVLILRRMVVLEEEGRARALIDSYGSEDMGRDSLYARRYIERQNWYRYEPFRQKLLYTVFDRLFLERLTWSTPDAPLKGETALQLCRVHLTYLHGLCGETPEAAHPISGNGTLDCLVHYRLPLGFAYSRFLAAAGEDEESLTALSDAVGLLEALFQEERFRPLPSRSPFLQGQYEIGAVALTLGSHNEPSEKHIRILHQDQFVYSDVYPSQYLRLLEEAASAEYASLQNSPRFENCLARLRALAAACAPS